MVRRHLRQRVRSIRKKIIRVESGIWVLANLVSGESVLNWRSGRAALRSGYGFFGKKSDLQKVEDLFISRECGRVCVTLMFAGPALF